MAWNMSKAFVGKVQLGSIILYLACLGGYAIPPAARAFEHLQEAAHLKVVEIAGFVFFSVFIASTVLLGYQKRASNVDRATGSRV